MSASRIAVATITVMIFGIVYCITGCRSIQAPKKTPGIKNPGNKGARTVTGNTRADKVIDNLKISVAIPSNKIKLGESLHISLSVENIGSKPHELLFNSGQKFDIRVEDASGQKVWLWSDGRMFTQMLETVTVEPGKDLSFDTEWPLMDSTGKVVKPGDYHIFGKIMATGLRDKEVKIGISVKT